MIDVALTPAGLRGADTVVVIDVLRASSTLTEALAAGYEQVLCVSSVERAAGLRGRGRVIAGERHCVRPPGFDQGNSPQDARQCQGTELVLATTNGAPAIVAAARLAPTVIVACLLNLGAVLKLLARDGFDGHDLQIVCSGTGGAAALEDAYAAGRLSAALSGRRTDAALIAEAVAVAYATPLEALAASADAAVLRDAGLEADIAHCAVGSVLDVVPVVVASAQGIATVRESGAVPDPAMTPAIP